MMDILVADDEKSLANFVMRGLRAEGYSCESVNQLHELLPYLRKATPQVLILDRMFDDEDSLEYLDKIKALPQPPMVLMLTALDEVSDKVSGLMGGADDYLCKPFDFDELLARITVLGRRHQISGEQVQEPVRQLASIELLLEQRIAKCGDEELSLTKIEFELLLYLAENIDKVVSRERILARVWQEKSDPLTNVVDVYISKLRKILSIEPRLSILTLRGSGYRLSLQEQST